MRKYVISQKYVEGVAQGLLYEMLCLNIKLDKFDKGLLVEYLKSPSRYIYLLKTDTKTFGLPSRFRDILRHVIDQTGIYEDVVELSFKQLAFAAGEKN